jgi:hypothetical protein
VIAGEGGSGADVRIWRPQQGRRSADEEALGGLARVRRSRSGIDTRSCGGTVEDDQQRDDEEQDESELHGGAVLAWYSVLGQSPRYLDY